MKKLLRFFRSFIAILFAVDFIFLTDLTPAVQAIAASNQTYITAAPNTYPQFENIKPSVLSQGEVPKESLRDAYDNLPGPAKTAIKDTKDWAVGKIIGNAGSALYKTGKAYSVQAPKLIAKGNKLATKAANLQREAQNAAKYSGVRKGATRRMNKLLAQSEQAAADSAKNLSKGNALRTGGKFLKATGVAMNAYGMYSDVKAFNDGLKNEHSSLRAVEGTLLASDFVLSGVGIAILVGAPISAPVAAGLLVAGSIVGIASSIVNSDTFSNWANGLDNGVLDFFDNLVDSLAFWKKTPSGVGAYKPNIYLYNAEGKLIRVDFVWPSLLTKTIPDYSGGWLVEAIDNDSHLVAQDGLEYDFLFYESITDRRQFKTEEGFIIHSSNRVQEWHSVLSSYGFNEQEISDFVEFWNEKLDMDQDYVMYPQFTDFVDMAMPIIIDPLPQNVVRMWFAFEAYDGNQVQKPEIVSFTHEGYTLVEWGGMVFD